MRGTGSVVVRCHLALPSRHALASRVVTEGPIVVLHVLGRGGGGPERSTYLGGRAGQGAKRAALPRVDCVGTRHCQSGRIQVSDPSPNEKKASVTDDERPVTH